MRRTEFDDLEVPGGDDIERLVAWDELLDKLAEQLTKAIIDRIGRTADRIRLLAKSTEVLTSSNLRRNEPWATFT